MTRGGASKPARTLNHDSRRNYARNESEIPTKFRLHGFFQAVVEKIQNRGLNLLSVSELVTTVTDDMAIANPAKIGLRKIPDTM
jgi:hypothetical protein